MTSRDRHLRAGVAAAALLAVPAVFGPAHYLAQTPSAPPIIDMHVHSTTLRPEDAGSMAGNPRYFFLASLASDLSAWSAAVDHSRYLPSLVFPCDRGRAAITGRPCFEGGADLPDLQWLRGEVKAGRVKALGELMPQFVNLAPADPRLAPYWALAEEFDLPVGIHMGPGPPGAAYESSPVPVKSPRFRMALGDPLLLEDVLLRHPKLRVFVMHAGWPRLDSTLALMYAHPQVYVDTAALQAPFVVPRAGYYRHLRGLVEAGFARRIMYGSDFPAQAAAGIAAIQEADFLTDAQKHDILCANAARFLRLDRQVCAD